MYVYMYVRSFVATIPLSVESGPNIIMSVSQCTEIVGIIVLLITALTKVEYEYFKVVVLYCITE